jgi:REP element-mobilizing transposase RayT
MTSPIALEYGQYYHIYNRGNNREDIFVEERNYQYFLKLYAKYIVPVADIYAYCLLRCHFHALVRIKTSDEQAKTMGLSEGSKAKRPSQQFGNLFNAYAKAINKTYVRTGSLFENPFGRVPVTSESHLVHLVAYIHQNPERHGLVEDFRLWAHSSYHALVSQGPTRLERDAVLAWFQGLAAFEDFHRRPAGEAQISHLVPDDSG